MVEQDFPDDENGAVLQEMASLGFDLTSIRMVDFEHVFPNEASARAFAKALEGIVTKINVIEPHPEDGDEATWEVQCRQRMVPTHAEITAVEARLHSKATEFGGHADGWGFGSNPDGSPSD